MRPVGACRGAADAPLWQASCAGAAAACSAAGCAERRRADGGASARPSLSRRLSVRGGREGVCCVGRPGRCARRGTASRQGHIRPPRSTARAGVPRKRKGSCGLRLAAGRPRAVGSRVGLGVGVARATPRHAMAVLAGGRFCVDTWGAACAYGVYFLTHAHADHTKGLSDGFSRGEVRGGVCGLRMPRLGGERGCSGGWRSAYLGASKSRACFLFFGLQRARAHAVC